MSKIPVRVSEKYMKNDHGSRTDSKEYLAKLDDYEIPPEVPLDPAKMKPNRFAGRAKFTHGGARNGAGRKPKPESQRTVRKTVTLYTSEIRFLRSLDPNLSKALHKLLESKAR
jgi:hypothetical protein